MKKLLILAVLIAAQTTLANNDKYRLILRNNPATSITVGWNQISGSDPVVYYGETDHGTSYSNYSFQKEVDRKVVYKGMNNHFARINNLKPNTIYFFVIKDSEGVSERFWFKTNSNKNEKLSFVAGGDSRNHRKPRQNANKIVAKLKPNAVLFGGDMTNSDTDIQWQEWMDDWQLTTTSDGQMIPIVAARGNHERDNASILNLFDTPSEHIYYALTFGKNLIRAYTLNTEIPINGGQTNWLKNDLKAHPNTLWKMAQYHKPMRPHVSTKREGNMQYDHWAQLFHKNSVKLVVECDAHTVKTTWPVRPFTGEGSDEGFIRDDKNGTTYVGEGCWGAPLRPNDDNKSWTRNSGKFNQVKWIIVSKKDIAVRTIKSDNADEVQEVDTNARFEVPLHLKIWTPSNGAVVTIKK